MPKPHSTLMARMRSLARHLPEPAKRVLRPWFAPPPPHARPPQTPLPGRAAEDSGHSYSDRVAAENAVFTDQVEVHDLPEIFHYWSNKYLRPKLERFGFSNPDEFFSGYLERAHRGNHDQPSRFASLGSGNCDTEVRIAQLLVARGITDFVIDCIDINPDMLARGRVLAAESGVTAQIAPLMGDFNDWQPAVRYDAILANQSLHHVMDLESLFSAIERSLKDDGAFLTSDMIGRNGHMRWPEALDVVQSFWHELPPSYRYNVQLRRHEEAFANWDCSGVGFEGIRAQDILPLLIEHFEFELFIPYANAIDPFIDRSFGPHFDPDSERDRDFIDRVHAADEAGIEAGTLTPTHMIAVLRRGPYSGPHQVIGHLTPQFCVRVR